MVYVAVIVASVGYVVFSAARQPAVTNRTFVGAAFARLTGQSERTHSNYGNAVFVAPFAGSWQVLSSYADHASNSDNLVVVRFLRPTHRVGVWHQVVETSHDLVTIDCWQDAAKQLDRASRLSILAAIGQAYPTLVPQPKIVFYASGGGSTKRILWLGVLGDLSILAALAAIVFSLVKLRSEVRWRTPGHCAECDYDLAGLTADRCPECGGAVILQPSTKVHDP